MEEKLVMNPGSSQLDRSFPLPLQVQVSLAGGSLLSREMNM